MIRVKTRVIVRACCTITDHRVMPTIIKSNIRRYISENQYKRCFFLILSAWFIAINTPRIDGAFYNAKSALRSRCLHKPHQKLPSSIQLSNNEPLVALPSTYKGDQDQDQYEYEYEYSYNPNLNTRREFQKNGIVYKKSILSPSEFQTIQREISNIPKHLLQNEKSNSVARKRLGMTLDSSSEIVRLLMCENGSLYRFINDIATSSSGNDTKENTKIVMSKAVPAEVRLEEKN